jgi:hypothetical protein
MIMDNVQENSWEIYENILDEYLLWLSKDNRTSILKAAGFPLDAEAKISMRSDFVITCVRNLLKKQNQSELDVVKEIRKSLNRLGIVRRTTAMEPLIKVSWRKL